jgi:hypothetical protein
MTDYPQIPVEGLTRRRFLQVGLILGGLSFLGASTGHAGTSPGG